MLVAFSISPATADETGGVAAAVAEAVRVVRASGLPNETTSMFTTVEGEWDEVMAVVKGAVDAVAAVSARVSLVLKADIRPGYDGQLTAKVARVEELLAAAPVSPAAGPSGHTLAGGVLVGSAGAPHLVLYEDPASPACRELAAAAGDLLRRETAAGALAVEHRLRCDLGEGSVRACAALALAAEHGHFDALLQQVYAAQPGEGTEGFTGGDLVALGQRCGLTSATYVDGVRAGRYRDWVVRTDAAFAEQAPVTPYALLDGRPVDLSALRDPDRLHRLLEPR